MSLKFNNAGTILVFGDKKGSLAIHNLRTKKVSKVKAHTARIPDVQFSPDDKLLATTSYDGTIKIWNTRNYAFRPVEIRAHEAWVLSLAFSRDGKYLVSGDAVERIYIWAAKNDYMADLICSKINRNMTKFEWKNYIGYDIEYQKTCLNK